MAQQLERQWWRRAGRWLKWRGLRVVQLLGFVLVGVGAYPYLRPFFASVARPPEVVDTFVLSLGVPVAGYGDVPIPSLRGLVFVAIGAAIIWAATSHHFH